MFFELKHNGTLLTTHIPEECSDCRYASQTSGLDNQYIEEIRQLENESAENEAAEKRLNELLAKRLDGEI